MTRLRRHGPWLAALIVFSAVVLWWWHRPLPEPDPLPPPRYLLPIYEDGLVGAIDTEGNVVVPPSYRTIQFVGVTKVSSTGAYYAWSVDVDGIFGIYPEDWPTAWMVAGQHTQRWQFRVTWPFARRMSETRYDMLDSLGRVVLRDIRGDSGLPVVQQVANPPRNFLVHKDGRLAPIAPIPGLIKYVGSDGSMVATSDATSATGTRDHLYDTHGKDVYRADQVWPRAPGFFGVTTPEDGSTNTRGYVAVDGELQTDEFIDVLDYGFGYRVSSDCGVELMNYSTRKTVLLDKPLNMSRRAEIGPAFEAVPGYLQVRWQGRLTIYDAMLEVVYEQHDNDDADFRFVPGRPDRLYDYDAIDSYEIDLTTGTLRRIPGVKIGLGLDPTAKTVDGKTLWGLKNDAGEWILKPQFTALERRSRGGYVVHEDDATTILAPDGTVLASGLVRYDFAEIGGTADAYRLFYGDIDGPRIRVRDDPYRTPHFMGPVDSIYGCVYGAFDAVYWNDAISGPNTYWIYDHKKKDWRPEGYFMIRSLDYDVLFVENEAGDFGYLRPDGTWIWRSNPEMK